MEINEEDEMVVLKQKQYQFILAQHLQASKREYLAISSRPGDPGYDTLAGLQNLAGIVKEAAFKQAADRAGWTGDSALDYETGALEELSNDPIYEAAVDAANTAIPESVIAAANAGVGIEDPVIIAQLKADRATAKATLLTQLIAIEA